MTGRVLSGRYELGDPLGEGGMAIVYRGLDRVLGRPVAIKMLRPRLSEDHELIERLQREARAAAKLSHPNLIDIYDVGEDHGDHFIVMALAEGGDLAELLAHEGALSPARVARLGAHLARALDYAHKHGVIHRDVKPHNVLLDAEGQPKLTDFGIARAVGTSPLTTAGIVLGTVHYMAPEQARGQQVGPAADVYSLGAMLYEAATGEPPFDADNPLALAMAHASQPPVPPRQLNPSIPPALEQVILTALAKDPAERHASAAEMAIALDAIDNPVNRRTAVIGAAPASASKPTARRAARPARGGAPTPAAAPPPPPPPHTPAPRPARSGLAPQRRSSGFGPMVLILMLLATLGFLGLGWMLLAGSGRGNRPPSTPTPAVLPTRAAPAVASPAATATRQASPTATVAASPTASSTSTAVPTATARVTATPVPPTTTPVPPTVPPVTMPALIGRPFAEAQAQLRVRQLRPEVTEVADPARPDGVVLDQDPKPDTPLIQGSAVRLTVNRLPMAPVPNVQGMTEDEARRALESKGFKVATDSGTGGRKGVVYDQSPQPNLPAPPGSTVKITVGR
ncbi:MAG: protein kinase [Chloroflexi bacterium]|nr:protein kinase [Chloroflexota bacterium]